MPDILKMKHFNIGELFDRIWIISKNFETCRASLLEALRNTLGKSLVPGSILNRCLISLPSHVKLQQDGKV